MQKVRGEYLKVEKKREIVGGIKQWEWAESQKMCENKMHEGERESEEKE